MGHWVVHLDKDFEREGFDPQTIAAEDVQVAASERFSATAVVVTAVLTYVGSKLLDHATDETLKRTIGHLVGFARSRDKKLRIEIEEHAFDPRIQVVAGQIESMDSDEFKAALAALPTIGVKGKHLLDHSDEYLESLWYVWQDGDWKFSYAMTEGGEIIEEEPGQSRNTAERE